MQLLLDPQEFIHPGWGDVASIAGLLVAIVGFIATILGVWKSKSAAEQAREAAMGARTEFARSETLVSVAAAVGMMEEIKRLHRQSAWPVLPDRYAYVRRALTSIRASHGSLSEQQRESLVKAAAQFRTMEETVDAYLNEGAISPDTVRFNKVVSIQIDRLDEILNTTKITEKES